MNCVLCGYNLDKENITHTVDVNGHRIIIKDMPANICKQCGEYYIENNATLNINKIIEEEKKNNAKIIVINYLEI